MNWTGPHLPGARPPELAPRPHFGAHSGPGHGAAAVGHTARACMVGVGAVGPPGGREPQCSHGKPPAARLIKAPEVIQAPQGLGKGRPLMGP